jgi:hypothetical protein
MGTFTLRNIMHREAEKAALFKVPLRSGDEETIGQK